MHKTRNGKKLSNFNNQKRAIVSGTSKARRRVMGNEGINVSRILLIFYVKNLGFYL